METAIPMWKTFPYGDFFLNPQMGTKSVWKWVSDWTGPGVHVIPSRHTQPNGKIVKKINFLTRKSDFLTGKSVFLARKPNVLTRKHLFHIHNLSTRSYFFAKFFQLQNRDSPFPFEDVPSPGDPCMETGGVTLYVEMYQSYSVPFSDRRWVQKTHLP